MDAEARRRAPQGLHDALDQLVTMMARENRTYGEARVTWVDDEGGDGMPTVLTLDLDPDGAEARRASLEY